MDELGGAQAMTGVLLEEEAPGETGSGVKTGQRQGGAPTVPGTPSVAGTPRGWEPSREQFPTPPQGPDPADTLL